MALSLSTRMTAFIDEVLRLNLELAAFDCDGTLWSGDAGESFFWWELEHGVVSHDVAEWARSRYQAYRAGAVPEEIMCGEMVTIHRGIEEKQIQLATDHFFDRTLVEGIFPEMQELIRRLHLNGCQVWAVSSSSQWIIRSGMKYFGIPADRILATEVKVEEGIITDQLVRVPSGPGKPQAIRDVIKRTPNAAFGNSQWDVEMLEMAPHAFAINPNRGLQPVANEKRWTIYFPDSTGA